MADVQHGMAKVMTRVVVRVEPLGADIEPEPGETIIEAAWRLGYRWPTVCYGQATCTACHVEVVAGEQYLSPMEDDERDAIEHRLALGRNRDRSLVRLACRARATGTVTVRRTGVVAPTELSKNSTTQE
jgi:2Fe-2S ferredoxin